MDRKVKLIWDFRGGFARQTATRFLDEVAAYPLKDIGGRAGSRQYGPRHFAVFLIVPQEAVAAVRNSLQPDRAEYL